MPGLPRSPTSGVPPSLCLRSPSAPCIPASAVDPIHQHPNHTRAHTSPCPSPLPRSCSSDVYIHEMPGGQYTNLKFQAASLGLGDEWERVKNAYAAANRALGDIVKASVPCCLVPDSPAFTAA